MEKIEMSEALLEAKRERGFTWAELSAEVGMSEVWLASVFYGESSATEEVATKIARILDLPENVRHAMADYPIKGNANSRIYHMPTESSYEQTIPEFCFATEADAKAAGFRARKH